MDKTGHIDSHDIDRNAKLTLHEKLDPNSKTQANIEKEPHTETGSYKDYQLSSPSNTLLAAVRGNFRRVRSESACLAEYALARSGVPCTRLKPAFAPH
jgi:hypothetical protein